MCAHYGHVQILAPTIHYSLTPSSTGNACLLAGKLLLGNPIAHDLAYAVTTFASLVTSSVDKLVDFMNALGSYPLLLFRFVLPFNALQGLRIPKAHFVVAGVRVDDTCALICSNQLRSTLWI